MKDQLITFETALLAKEKGFDEYCRESYLNSSKETYSHLSEGISSIRKHGYLKRKSLIRKNSDMINAVDERFSAPTQTVLQRWLREKHNLHIILNTSINTNGKVTFYCNTIKFGKNLYKSVFRSKSLIYTYEEALEIGLQEGLKLIK